MKPQARYLTDQLEQLTEPACRLERRLTGGIAIIGISLVFAISCELVKTHLLPDINVWLIGLAPAVWLVIHLATKGYRAPAGPVAPESATATPAATHP